MTVGKKKDRSSPLANEISIGARRYFISIPGTWHQCRADRGRWTNAPADTSASRRQPMQISCNEPSVEKLPAAPLRWGRGIASLKWRQHPKETRKCPSRSEMKVAIFVSIPPLDGADDLTWRTSVSWRDFWSLRKRTRPAMMSVGTRSKSRKKSVSNRAISENESYSISDTNQIKLTPFQWKCWLDQLTWYWSVPMQQKRILQRWSQVLWYVRITFLFNNKNPSKNSNFPHHDPDEKKISLNNLQKEFKVPCRNLERTLLSWKRIVTNLYKSTKILTILYVNKKTLKKTRTMVNDPENPSRGQKNHILNTT